MVDDEDVNDVYVHACVVALVLFNVVDVVVPRAFGLRTILDGTARQRFMS